MFHLQRKAYSRLLCSVATDFQWAHTYSVAVVGAPFWNGQFKPGTEQGPDSLRGFGLLNKLNQIQENVVDFGNLNFGLSEFLPRDIPESTSPLVNKNEFLLARMCSQLSRFVATSIEQGHVPLILGGDHSIAVGSVLGTCNAPQFREQDISLVSGMLATWPLATET